MTTAARTAEADGASVAFQIALTQVGAKTIEDALTLWSDLPADMQAATAQRWLGKAIQLVMFRRQRSQALALAYYRLARALRTGKTIADPYNPEPSYISLDTLRREFASLTDPSPQDTGQEPAANGSADTDPASGTPEGSEASQPPQGGGVEVEADDPDDDLILVEELEGLKAEMDRIEKEAEAETRSALSQLGAMNSIKKQRQVDAKADDAAAKKAAAHKKAGKRQAASAERITMNGARSTIYATGSRDARVIGWIRLSRTGTPCGWCAMLISRGPTTKDGRQILNLYRSKRGAQHQGNNQDEDKYHDNCKCYAMPVYSVADFESSDLYALNRLYAEQWPRVTSGLSGDSALHAWRNFIRRQQADAQVAAA